MCSIQVAVIPLKLRLCSIPKGKFYRYTQAFLKLFLFPETSQARNTSYFFNFSETPQEISAVAEDGQVKELERIQHGESDGAVFAKRIWIPLQICEGADGFQGTAVVQKVSLVLANEGISIFFVSTFSEDYVLVGQEDLPKALQVLGSSFNLDLDMPCEEDFKSLSKPSSRPRSRTPSTVQSPQVNCCEPDELEVVTNNPQFGKRQKQPHPLSVPPLSQLVYKLSREFVTARAASIMELFFFPEDSIPRFLSFTETESEITLVVPESASAKLEKSSLAIAQAANEFIIDSKLWRPIQIGNQPIGLLETGIVAAFSDVLSKAEVDIFYISTFMSDFGMVPADKLTLAVATLQESYNIITNTYFSDDQKQSESSKSDSHVLL